MSKLFMVTDEQGNLLADNLREAYAMTVALHIARHMGQEVTLYDRSAAANDDGVQVSPVVEPLAQRSPEMEAYA